MKKFSRKFKILIRKYNNYIIRKILLYYIIRIISIRVINFSPNNYSRKQSVSRQYLSTMIHIVAKLLKEKMALADAKELVSLAPKNKPNLGSWKYKMYIKHFNKEQHY